jgi:hypothetical protein
MDAIPVIYSFARSGGTLVNQLLGVHPQCLVLSEVNPTASYKSIVEQAVEWLELVETHEVEEFSHLPYQQKIITLHQRSAEHGKRLIVRDWVTVNFLPECAGDLIIPSGQLEQKLYLEHAGFESMPLVIVRRSAAVYESIKQNFLHLRNLKIEVFAESYLEYARAVTAFPRIHMETLRAQPDITLKKILQWLDLNPDDSRALIKNFHDFKNCTGNTTLQATSESANARQILPPEVLNSPPPVFTGSHPALAEADRLLNYG